MIPPAVHKERVRAVLAKPLREAGTIRVGVPYETAQELERFEKRVAKAKRGTPYPRELHVHVSVGWLCATVARVCLSRVRCLVYPFSVC